MYIGFTGTRGASAIPSLLYGDMSPSGKTVDTFAYDFFTNPHSFNISSFIPFITYINAFYIICIRSTKISIR